MAEEITRKIRVYGIVQGVGFRPTVDRHAHACGIRGSVSNRGPYVEIFAQGKEEAVERFLSLLRHEPPRRAAILKIDVHDAPEGTPQFPDFSIITSERTSGEIFVSPDIAICEECKEELFDPHNRRYLHPFINCTCCGPRLTILESLPYDRERTSMREFPMCPQCDQEYHDPASRRYDAQPVCCNDCGPEVYLLPDTSVRGHAAITQARRTIAGGGIVAVKGIGGFHLCCDATAESAVAALRQRKHRPVKPFALMMRDEETVRRHCRLTETQREILVGHQKPILLLERRPDEEILETDAKGWDQVAGHLNPAHSHGAIAPLVAPGNPKVGVMLPYVPLQCLLFDYDDEVVMPDVLVMTSGNVSGAPICRDDEEAQRELSAFTDCILSHNRSIRIRADDSVMDFFDDVPYMIRRSRGYAPLPYLLSRRFPDTVLAVGGELKNTFCIGKGNLFYPSSYIGDLADVRTVRALSETIGRMQTLLEAEPTLIASDLHPGYQSTAVAQQLAKERGLPLVQIQHHYAHIVACTAENDVSERVIGVSFDGTGYGTDGTIWGGEILLADWHGFTREASITPFLQLGGDASSREGWRIAVSMLLALCGRDGSGDQRAGELCERLGLCDARTFSVQRFMAQKGINAVQSTSAGRLFDGVSALLGICRASTFEGEASTALQHAAERWLGGERTEGRDPVGEERLASLPVVSPAGVPADASVPSSSSADRDLLATDALVRDLLERRLCGEDAEQLAFVFHRELAATIVREVLLISQRTGVRICALSGGCFQNTLLLELCVRALSEAGLRVLTHHLLPPNDGGICLGQAVAAAQRQMDDREKNGTCG